MENFHFPAKPHVEGEPKNIIYCHLFSPSSSPNIFSTYIFLRQMK